MTIGASPSQLPGRSTRRSDHRRCASVKRGLEVGIRFGNMRLTPTDRDRLLIFTAAELARARRARGLRLNVPEATALIADPVCEAGCDGAGLMAAAAAGAAVLTVDDVLPGVPDIVNEVKVEAVFDDGT